MSGRGNVGVDGCYPPIHFHLVRGRTEILCSLWLRGLEVVHTLHVTNCIFTYLRLGLWWLGKGLTLAKRAFKVAANGAREACDPQKQTGHRTEPGKRVTCCLPKHRATQRNTGATNKTRFRPVYPGRDRLHRCYRRGCGWLPSLNRHRILTRVACYLCPCTKL